MTRDFITEIKETHKVNYAGVAKLANAHEFILQQGGDYLARFPYAVSLGLALPNAIVDLLPKRDVKGIRESYRHHAYDVINLRLDFIASEVALSLQNEGYQAFPIPASKITDKDELCSIFSHKLAAHLSGLGWIGKSCLLITPENGPRVRWATVLTDAPLQTTGEPMENRCGDCTQCVDICPVHAFTGRQFQSDEPRQARYKAELCDRYFDRLEAKWGLGVCGLCLYSCPYGMKSG